MKNSNRKPLLTAVMDAVRTEPLTSREIAERIGAKLNLVRTTLSYATQQGKVKIVGSIILGGHGRSSYRYICEAQPEQPTFPERVLELLKDHPGLSAAEIAEELRRHLSSKSLVSGTLDRLHKRKRLIRITGYRLNPQTLRQVALYALAKPGCRDAEKPKRVFTAAQHCARYRDRKKARKPSVFGQLPLAA